MPWRELGSSNLSFEPGRLLTLRYIGHGSNLRPFAKKETADQAGVFWPTTSRASIAFRRWNWGDGLGTSPLRMTSSAMEPSPSEFPELTEHARAGPASCGTCAVTIRCSPPPGNSGDSFSHSARSAASVLFESHDEDVLHFLTCQSSNIRWFSQGSSMSLRRWMIVLRAGAGSHSIGGHDR